jgi:hypothetical protein
MTTDLTTSLSRLRKWRFNAINHCDAESVTPLWLEPELECSSCIADTGIDLQDGAGQFAYYVDYIRREYPLLWEADAVPIYWSVCGDGISEFAPNDPNDLSDENFLTFFTPPVDARTGEPLNWWKLPVRDSRFPAFAKALGWTPSAFQAFAPLRSIVANRVSPTKRRTSEGQSRRPGVMNSKKRSKWNEHEHR